MNNRPHLAIATPGFSIGGGVPRVAQFLRDVGRGNGFDVTIIDLATSKRDSSSSRLLQPRSLLRGPRLRPDLYEQNLWRAGCHLAELEPSRYVQTSALRRYLSKFEVVQVVAGTPAWALAVRGIQAPVALQVATTTKWERASRDATGGLINRRYRRAMTELIDHLDALGARVPDATFAENRRMLSWMHDAARSDSSVTLIPPGIDTDLFSPKDGPWDPGRPLITVGRMGDERKGLERLLHSYIHLTRNVAGVPKLRIVGRGSPTTRAQRLLEVPEIAERVEIHQDATDEDLANLLATSSVFVATPYEEGLGLAALEAMSSGLPVIVTETAGSREYVRQGKTGFLLPQVTDSLPSLLVREYETCRNKGPILSANARKSVLEHFSVHTTATAFVEVWRSLLRDGETSLFPGRGLN